MWRRPHYSCRRTSRLSARSGSRISISISECAAGELYSECATGELYSKCATGELYSKCAAVELYSEYMYVHEVNFTLSVHGPG